METIYKNIKFCFGWDYNNYYPGLLSSHHCEKENYYQFNSKLKIYKQISYQNIRLLNGGRNIRIVSKAGVYSEYVLTTKIIILDVPRYHLNSKNMYLVCLIRKKCWF